MEAEGTRALAPGNGAQRIEVLAGDDEVGGRIGDREDPDVAVLGDRVALRTGHGAGPYHPADGDVMAQRPDRAEQLPRQ